ncbi:RidA family protein [Variovorax sp. PCZ-1]|uniref:RidA family protein n=1 Tax=Variovorax sp. PCZ-1 TaxID=2835533 RepID=UPI0032DEAD0B
MKSVINAAARRNMDAVKEKMGQEALDKAAQAIRLRSEDMPTPPGLKAATAMPKALPSLGDAPDVTSPTGQPLANYLAAKRVGNLLYMSGVIAVDPAAKKVITSYDDLPAHARQELRSLGYDTGQLSVDVFEAPIVAQSWFVLSRIREIAQQHGAQMSDVFKLVQYFRDLRHYPAYNRVRQIFCPAGVVSTVVEVSGMLPSSEVLIEVEATAVLV